MTGHHPYYVRRGWVDKDGHIRCNESSLKIMNNTDDVYGEQATDDDNEDDDDSMADAYTYPAPSEDADDNPYTAGYFYLGEMIELVDSMPPSPTEETSTSPLAAGESADDGALGPLAALTTSNTVPHFHMPSFSADDTYSLGQISDVYDQSLPYSNLQTNGQSRSSPQSRSITARHGLSTRHNLTSMNGSFATGHLSVSLSTATSHVTAPPVMPPTGYAPPVAIMTSLPATGLLNTATHITPHTSYAPVAPTMNSLRTTGLDNAATPVTPHTNFVPIAPNMSYPYRPVNGSTSSPGDSILTLPNGPRVGQPVPADLHPIINAISNLKVIGKTEHPERKILKKPYDGPYQTASKDRQLIRDHFASGSGLLKMDSPLRDWYGDLRVFSAKMWEFLAVQKTRLNVSVKD
jgi:hypothetical protein